MSGLRLGVVLNPTAGAGRGDRRGRQTLAELGERGHQVVRLAGPDRASVLEQARTVAREGLDALVAVGGDGTVNLAAQVVAGTDIPLGIVAAGTGDDVVRALGLPRHDLSAAVRRIEDSMESGGRRVDAARAVPVGGAGDGVWFLAVLSAGFDAAVNARANTMRRPRGPLRYVRALVGELRGFRPYGYRVVTDETTWESAGTLVAVANTPSFGGGMRIAPDAVLDDGLLDVLVAGPLTRRGLLAVFPKVYRGAHVSHRACRVLRTRTVLIEPSGLGASPPRAYADGEPVGRLPIRVEAVPGAVRVLA